MSREILTIQLGQCGNQIGEELWRRLCVEHNIGADGELKDPDVSKQYLGLEYKRVFFAEDDNHRFYPRALLVDLEPRVINGIRNSDYGKIYNTSDIYISKEGGGAGNNFTVGYAHGSEHAEAIFDMMSHEIDVCDNLEGFIMCHSVAGGTGSGLGAYMLERLVDLYPKKLIQTHSVFPNVDADSDVVVQPYNTILNLSRLAEFADNVMVLDNTALHRIVTNDLRHSNPSMQQLNAIISNIMAMSSSTLRFPSLTHNTLIGLCSGLIPMPELHFIMSCYEPLNLCFLNESEVYDQQRTTVSNTLRSLIKSRSMFISLEPVKDRGQGFISAMAILQGQVKIEDVQRAIQMIQEKNLLKFVPWKPGALQTALPGSSPYLNPKYNVSGLMLANHTSISGVFHRLIKQFDKLMKRRAFLEQYRRQDLSIDIETEMKESCEKVFDVAERYQAAAHDNFEEYMSMPRDSKACTDSQSFSEWTDFLQSDSKTYNIEISETTESSSLLSMETQFSSSSF